MAEARARLELVQVVTAQHAQVTHWSRHLTMTLFMRITIWTALAAGGNYNSFEQHWRLHNRLAHHSSACKAAKLSCHVLYCAALCKLATAAAPGKPNHYVANRLPASLPVRISVMLQAIHKPVIGVSVFCCK